MQVVANMKKQKLGRIFAFFVLFILIACSSETLLFGTNNNQAIKNLGYLIFAGLVVALFIIAVEQRISYNNNAYLLLGAFLALSLLSCLTNFDFDIKYPYEFLLLFAAFLTTKLIGLEEFKKQYSNLMLFLSLFSLVGLFLASVAYPFVIKFPVITNISGLRYYNLFFTMIPSSNTGTIGRNYGIFREPGMFAVYLCLGLIFELFRDKNINLFKLIIFSITIFMTYSTAGYILSALLFLVFLLRKPVPKTNHKLVKYIVLGIICCVLLFGWDAIYAHVIKKLQTENASRSARFGSIRVNLELLFRQPWKTLFGLGFTQVENSYIIVANELNIDINNTNTLFKILAVHGIVYAILIISLLYLFFAKVSKNKAESICLFIIFIMAISNEDLIVNGVVYLLGFYAINQRNECIEEGDNS